MRIVKLYLLTSIMLTCLFDCFAHAQVITSQQSEITSLRFESTGSKIGDFYELYSKSRTQNKLANVVFPLTFEKSPQVEPHDGKDAQIIIRVYNNSQKTIPIYVAPKSGYFFYDGNRKKEENSDHYSFNIKNGQASDIAITAKEGGTNYIGTANGEIYIGGKRQEDACYFHLKFTTEANKNISSLFCEKNFVDSNCYSKFSVGFTYLENVMTIIVLDKDSSDYVNDGSC